MCYRSRRRRATLQLSSKKFGCFKSVSWPLAKVRVTTESLVDTLWCNVTRDPQVAYLSRRKHFLVKNGQNRRMEKGVSWSFKPLLLMKQFVSPWKCFTISFSWWEQDSNLLGSNVVSENPHLRYFEEKEMKHTYLDERSTTITKVVPPGRGCSIALRSGWPLRFPQMWETRRRHFC